MRRAALVIAMLAAGCGAELDGGGNIGGSTIDAPPGSSSTIDAPPGVTVDAAPDAPACFNGRVVYLNFDGQALTQGPSDATLNRASWMQIASGTAPPYRSGDGNRTGQIMSITTMIREQLSGFPITVVTTRPAQGPYVMIVFGGTAAQVGSRFGGAVNTLDCGDVAKSDVAWISDNITGQRAANFAVGAIGFGLGLTATLDPNDCMCGWDNQCTSNNNAACTLTPGIARDPAANQRCAGLTTQDEVQTFRQAFCQ